MTGDTAVPSPLSAEACLDGVAALLDAVEWTPETLDKVAALVRASGRVLRDVEPSDEAG